MCQNEINSDKYYELFRDIKKNISDFLKKTELEPSMKDITDILEKALKSLLEDNHNELSIDLTLRMIYTYIDDTLFSDNMPITIEKINTLHKELERTDVESGYSMYDKHAKISALKALIELCHIGYSKANMLHLYNLLTRYLRWQPTTPLEDNEDDWTRIYSTKDYDTYFHKKCRGIYKDISKDGKNVKYIDIERVYGLEEGSIIAYHSGFLDDIVNEYFPIKFPYLPREVIYRVNTETYLIDEKNSNFNIKAILSIEPSNSDTIVPVNRYFIEHDENIIEIKIDEYIKLKEKVIKPY